MVSTYSRLQAQSRAITNGLPATSSRLSSQSASPASPGLLDAPRSEGVPAEPRLGAALATIKRSPAAAGSLGQAPAAASAASSWEVGPADAGRAAQAGGTRASLRHAADRPFSSALGSQRLVLPPAGNDFEPEYAGSADSPHPGSGGSGASAQAYPGFQPPSPISLLPRYDLSPPSIDLRPPSPTNLQLRYEPPSPISLSLAPRQEPPSPGGHICSPPQRPYAGLGRASSLGRWGAGQGLPAIADLGWLGWRQQAAACAA